MTTTDHGDQEELILWFARHCWVRANRAAPSGKKWSEVFEAKTGLTLQEYRRQRDEDKLSKK